MRRLLAAASVLATALACAASPPAVDPATLSLDRVRVEEASSSGTRGKTFVAATLVAAPVARLCAIIQDYPGYPSFMPNVGKAEVVKTTPDSVTVNMTLELPLGQAKRYRLQLEPTVTPASCHLAWKLVPWEGLAPADTIADTTGYWHLAPLPSDPTRTVVEYHVHADPGPVPFGFGWIVDMMSKRSLPRTLEAVRARAQQAPQLP